MICEKLENGSAVDIQSITESIIHSPNNSIYNKDQITQQIFYAVLSLVKDGKFNLKNIITKLETNNSLNKIRLENIYSESQILQDDPTKKFNEIRQMVYRALNKPSEFRLVIENDADKQIKNEKRQSEIREEAQNIKNHIANKLANSGLGYEFKLNDFFPNIKVISPVLASILIKFIRDGLIELKKNGISVHSTSDLLNNLGLNQIEITQLVTADKINEEWFTKIFSELKAEREENEKRPTIGNINLYEVNSKTDKKLLEEQIKRLEIPNGYIALYRGIRGKYIPPLPPTEIENVQNEFDNLNNKMLSGQSDEISDYERTSYLKLGNILNFQRPQSYTGDFNLAFSYATDIGQENSTSTLIRMLVKSSDAALGKNGINRQHSGVTPGGIADNYIISRELEYNYFNRKD